MLDEVLLAALLIGWAAVLLPSALRSRRSADPIVTVGGFTEAMAVLRGRPQGREIMVPGQADRIVGHQGSPAARARADSVPTSAPSGSARGGLLRRRKAVFVRLLVATVATLGLALPIGGLLWPLFVTTGLALFGYVALLRHYKVERDEARSVVRAMHRERRRQPVTESRDGDLDRQPVAVGAEAYGIRSGGEAHTREPFGREPYGREAYGGVAVATRPDAPWEPQASVRIRRWET